jgi:hypothetical protein
MDSAIVLFEKPSLGHVDCNRGWLLPGCCIYVMYAAMVRVACVGQRLQHSLNLLDYNGKLIGLIHITLCCTHNHAVHHWACSQ